MIQMAPVLAGIEEVIGPILFVLVVIVSVIGQVMAKWREAQQQAQRRGQASRPARPAGNPPRPAGSPQRTAAGSGKPAPGGRDPLKDEIGEFLRRAAERRGGTAAPAPTRPVPAPPRPVRPAQPPVTAEVVPPRPPQLSTLKTHVGEKRVGTTGLGHDIEQADEEMEKHLQAVFEHRVGTLSRADAEAMARTASSPTASIGLIAMLQDPLSLRQAIVLNEILNRPEHRWE